MGSIVVPVVSQSVSQSVACMTLLPPHPPSVRLTLQSRAAAAHRSQLRMPHAKRGNTGFCSDNKMKGDVM